MVVLILRSAHAQALPQSRKGVRASRRMRTATAWPSCFETHRSAAESLKATCCSRCDAPQHEGAATYHPSVSAESREEPTCGCGKWPPGPLHCFRIVIYNGWRNPNVSAVIGSQNIPSSWGREPHVFPRRAPLSLSSMSQRGEVRLTVSALWSAMCQWLEPGGEPFGVRVGIGEKSDESPRGLRLRAVRHQGALVARRDLQQRRHRTRERQAFAFRDFAHII